MDIDIDFQTSFSPEKIFPHCIRAAMIEGKDIKPHLVGVYFQYIPTDKITGLAAIPYKKAEKLGFFKVDMLHLKLLDRFQSKAEMRKLLRKKPQWDMLKDEAIVSKLFHISKHFDLVTMVEPKSVQDLADILAIIRPGKRKLLEKYINNKESVIDELYTKRSPSDLRRSHAIAYAMNIVLQMNLLSENT